MSWKQKVKNDKGSIFRSFFCLHRQIFQALKRADCTGTKKGTIAASRVDPKH